MKLLEQLIAAEPDTISRIYSETVSHVWNSMSLESKKVIDSLDELALSRVLFEQRIAKTNDSYLIHALDEVRESQEAKFLEEAQRANHGWLFKRAEEQTQGQGPDQAQELREGLPTADQGQGAYQAGNLGGRLPVADQAEEPGEGLPVADQGAMPRVEQPPIYIAQQPYSRFGERERQRESEWRASINRIITVAICILTLYIYFLLILLNNQN